MSNFVAWGMNCSMLMKLPFVHRKSCGETLITMTKRYYVLTLLLLSRPLALKMTLPHKSGGRKKEKEKIKEEEGEKEG